MRHALCTALGLLLASGLAHAEPDSHDIAQISNVSTGGTVVVETNSTATFVNGYVKAILLDLSGHATPTVDVDIVTSGTHMPRVTLLSINNVFADAIYYPRAIAEQSSGADFTNESVPIPIVHDKIEFILSNAHISGVTGKVDIVIDPNP